MPYAWFSKYAAFRYAASSCCLVMRCRTLAAIRSSRTFLATVSAAQSAAWVVLVAIRMHAFLTYCWASVEPPCTWLPDSVLIRARTVPCRSKAPWE